MKEKSRKFLLLKPCPNKWESLAIKQRDQTFSGDLIKPFSRLHTLFDSVWYNWNGDKDLIKHWKAFFFRLEGDQTGLIPIRFLVKHQPFLVTKQCLMVFDRQTFPVWTELYGYIISV